MTDSPLALQALITWHQQRADAAARLVHELECQAAQHRGAADAHHAAIQELIARAQQAADAATEPAQESRHDHVHGSAHDRS